VVSLGPRTTVFAVLEAHPFLEEYLLAYHEAFRRIARPGGRTGWTRMTTLGDVAIEMDVTWRRLVRDRQSEALEALRRLRLAVAGDDAGSTVENGIRLLDLLGGLAATEEQVLAPIAERAFSPGDWAAVRELEDGVGWSLIAAPPPWPGP
jgi:hypothetical protein